MFAFEYCLNAAIAASAEISNEVDLPNLARDRVSVGATVVPPQSGATQRLGRTQLQRVSLRVDPRSEIVLNAHPSIMVGRGTPLHREAGNRLDQSRLGKHRDSPYLRPPHAAPSAAPRRLRGRAARLAHQGSRPNLNPGRRTTILSSRASRRAGQQCCSVKDQEN